MPDSLAVLIAAIPEWAWGAIALLAFQLAALAAFWSMALRAPLYDDRGDSDGRSYGATRKRPTQ